MLNVVHNIQKKHAEHGKTTFFFKIQSINDDFHSANGSISKNNEQ